MLMETIQRDLDALCEEEAALVARANDPAARNLTTAEREHWKALDVRINALETQIADLMEPNEIRGWTRRPQPNETRETRPCTD